MGHAGAIISGSSGTAAEKIAAFERAGIAVMKRPADVVPLISSRIRTGRIQTSRTRTAKPAKAKAKPRRAPAKAKRKQ
jgi:hypothetical protein